MSLLGFPDAIPFDIDPCFDAEVGEATHEIDYEFHQDLLYEDCHCIRCEVPFFLFPFPLG